MQRSVHIPLSNWLFFMFALAAVLAGVIPLVFAGESEIRIFYEGTLLYCPAQKDAEKVAHAMVVGTTEPLEGITTCKLERLSYEPKRFVSRYHSERIWARVLEIRDAVTDTTYYAVWPTISIPYGYRRL